MRVAAIDLGTNTFHLLIAEKKSNGIIDFVYRKTCVVKLGREGLNDGMISEAAFQRGVDAVKKFAVLLRRFRPDKIITLATSGIRNCKNAEEFISRSEKIIRSKIEIISGDREAELIYWGVINSHPPVKKNFLIMDIGGGSVEFIIAGNEKILWKKSIESGAARLLEIFSLSNPATATEISRMNNYLRKMFSPVFIAAKKYNPEILIGSSGSFDSFALMTGIRSTKPFGEIPLNRYLHLHHRLIRSARNERLKMKGLHRMRIDMIIPASVCANFILRETGIKKLFRSAYALREGIIFSALA